MRTDRTAVVAEVTQDGENAMSGLDLKIRIVPAPAMAPMWSKTDDGCGRTCESACPNTGC
jgi:FxLD family lantipeptide